MKLQFTKKSFQRPQAASNYKKLVLGEKKLQI